VENISLDYLMCLVENYSMEDKEKIKRAYKLANELHKGQFRQSGEPYIIHPLNVSIILAELNADVDTICAGLLHDVIEDTPITKEEIACMFNQDVATLVDGVTKISKLNFSTKTDAIMANTRKIILGITEDVRIIIIKLADRLHNMRTLQFKSVLKQRENAIETLEIFVPLAYYIGAYRIKSELEDLSLKYIEPGIYEEIKGKQEKVEAESKECLTDMLLKIKGVLEDQNIPNEIKLRIKNIYGIYKSLDYKKVDSYKRLEEIHDLHSLKIMVDNIPNCYLTLGNVHSMYHPINDKFKDYISNPKTNMYRSIHTTVFGPEERLVQAQIRTFQMDKVASFGLTTYWNQNGIDVRSVMQEELKTKFQFFRSLVEIDKIFLDNKDFVKQVKKELFTDRVYVYTPKGDIIELPKGSTAIDFAYQIHTHIGNNMVVAVVNDEAVPFNYELKNKDRVKIITTNDLSYGPREDWLNLAKTTRARRKIIEYCKR